MIRGCKLWDDRKTFSVQTNNAVEAMLRAWSGKDTGFLETCGPTAAINVLEAMGRPTGIMSTALARIQPEDFLTLWMNDPKNHPGLGIPKVAMVNEWPTAYPNALSKVFGVAAQYIENQTFDWVATMVAAGRGCMICLKTPGHFLAVVAYDHTTKELIYRDPWPNRTGTDGFNLRMSHEEFDENVKPYVIVFG